MLGKRHCVERRRFIKILFSKNKSKEKKVRTLFVNAIYFNKPKANFKKVLFLQTGLSTDLEIHNLKLLIHFD